MTDTTMRPVIHDVFVARSTSERAQIEQFTYTHDNFTHKHLGTLCGFFVVKESSSWSDYTAHALTAHARTAYFSHYKKESETNFAHALTTINASLAQIADKSDEVWTGLFDGVLCAYTEGRIVFSATGDGTIFLLRDGVLTEISAGCAPDLDIQSPTETFTDISSGVVLSGDKIILTSRELLSLVSQEELAKNARTMDNDSFVQFITTVLTNECALASTHIIDMEGEKILESSQIESSQKTDTASHAFSAQSYSRPAAPLSQEDPDEEPDLHEGDYTDKRTGHIYVQGETESSDRSLISPFAEYTDDITLSLSEGVSHAARKVRAQSARVRAGAPSLFMHLRTYSRSFFCAVRDISIATVEILHKTKKTVSRDHGDEQDFDHIETDKLTSSPVKKEVTLKKSFAVHKKARILRRRTSKKNLKKEISTLKEIRSVDLAKKMHPQAQILLQEDSPSVSATKIESYLLKLSSLCLTCSKKSRKVALLFCGYVRKWISHISTSIVVRKKFFTFFARSRTQEQPINKITPQNQGMLAQAISFLARHTTLILATIFFILIIYMFWWMVHSNTSTTTRESPDISLLEESTSAEKNQAPGDVAENESLDMLVDPITLTDKGGSYVVRSRGTTYITEPSGITTLSGSTARTSSLPTGVGVIAHSTYMRSAHLFFIVTTANTLYAFDPRTGAFTRQTIAQTISFDDISAITTHDTDLIIAGRETLTRHKRQANGFAGGTEILSTPHEFIDTHNILTQEDSLYALSDTGVLYIVDGNTAILDAFTGIHARSGDVDTDGNIWVLDTKNLSLLHIERDTFRIIDTFTHPLLASANALAIDGNKAYVTTRDSTLLFNLKKK